MDEKSKLHFQTNQQIFIGTEGGELPSTNGVCDP